MKGKKSTVLYKYIGDKEKSNREAAEWGKKWGRGTRKRESKGEKGEKRRQKKKERGRKETGTVWRKRQREKGGEIVGRNEEDEYTVEGVWRKLHDRYLRGGKT